MRQQVISDKTNRELLTIATTTCHNNIPDRDEGNEDNVEDRDFRNGMNPHMRSQDVGTWGVLTMPNKIQEV